MSDKFTPIERLVMELDSVDDCFPSTFPRHRDRHVNRRSTKPRDDLCTTSEPGPPEQHDSTLSSCKFDTFTSPKYDAFSEVGAVGIPEFAIDTSWWM